MNEGWDALCRAQPRPDAFAHHSFWRSWAERILGPLEVDVRSPVQYYGGPCDGASVVTPMKTVMRVPMHDGTTAVYRRIRRFMYKRVTGYGFVGLDLEGDNGE